MALFCNAKDRNLPRLTTLFQVSDIVDESDPQSSELFAWMVKEKKNTTQGDHRLVPKTDANRECFRRLKAVHGVAKQIMVEMHARHSVSREAIERLSKMRETMPPEHQAKAVICVPGKTFTVDGREWIAPQHILSIGGVPAYDLNIGRDVVEELIRRIQDTPEAFAECAECKSIYIRDDARAVYCSVRCGQRRLMRDRQRKKA